MGAWQSQNRAELKNSTHLSLSSRPYRQRTSLRWHCGDWRKASDGKRFLASCNGGHGANGGDGLRTQSASVSTCDGGYAGPAAVWQGRARRSVVLLATNSASAAGLSTPHVGSPRSTARCYHPQDECGRLEYCWDNEITRHRVVRPQIRDGLRQLRGVIAGVDPPKVSTIAETDRPEA